jgi:hypothetical protein
MTRHPLEPAGDLGGRGIPILVTPAGGSDQAAAALAHGADMIDLGDASQARVAAVVAALRGARLRTGNELSVLTWQPAAARSGHGLLGCADLAAARASGLPAGQVAVLAGPDGAPAVKAGGYLAMLDADRAAGGQEPAALAAAAAVGTWLGFDLIWTRQPLPARRAIDMTATIAGLRAPVRAIRGLA